MPALKLPTIKLSQELEAACVAWGARSCGGYTRGEKNGSLIYARPGIAQSVPHQAMGKMGECAFCLWVGLDPRKDVDWSPKLDPGWDFILNGAKVDVKASATRKLMWPVTKNAFLPAAPFHFLVLVEVRNPPVCMISGFASKPEFIARHKIADGSTNLDAGTKYLDRQDLRRIDNFPPLEFCCCDGGEVYYDERPS